MHIETFFDGVQLITPEQHGDERGVFAELYNDSLFPCCGSEPEIQQVNYSSSRQGTVRGIHYDTRPYGYGMGKFVTCVSGAVWDVAVNLETGEHRGKMLGPSQNQLLYIPPGYGHGFQALTEGAVLVYFCTATHDPLFDKAVNPLDADISIEWPREIRHMSERDRTAPDWKRPST